MTEAIFDSISAKLIVSKLQNRGLETITKHVIKAH